MHATVGERPDVITVFYILLSPIQLLSSRATSVFNKFSVQRMKLSAQDHDEILSLTCRIRILERSCGAEAGITAEFIEIKTNTSVKHCINISTFNWRQRRQLSIY